MEKGMGIISSQFCRHEIGIVGDYILRQLLGLKLFPKRPFQNVLAKDLLNLLKNGGRLEQPDNCSTELYTLLLTCWFLAPETRPKFSKISDELKNMEYSSKRYIVITPTKPKTPKTANSINKEQYQN